MTETDCADSDVIAWLQERMTGDWFDPELVSERLYDALDYDFGISGHRQTLRLEWSLGHCQGDCVEIVGFISVGSLAERYPELQRLIEIPQSWAMLATGEHSEDMPYVVAKGGRDPEFEWHVLTRSCDRTIEQAIYEGIEDVRDWITNHLREAEAALERIGYDIIDDMSSEEYARDTFDSDPDHYRQLFMEDH